MVNSGMGLFALIELRKGDVGASKPITLLLFSCSTMFDVLREVKE